MAGRRKVQVELTIEDLDRELIARGAPKNNGADWALLQLDREVQGQEVAELSKDDVAPLQLVYVIGHPAQFCLSL
ncbi:MAG: hypothetical protein PVH61_13165 [Candidatus Aminicenantes bacterium]|jgi:hypothetical protein